MKILIEDLTFDAIIGILPQERTTPQRVRIECIIDYRYSDGNFINYADVAYHIEHSVQYNCFQLVEEALESLASTLKKEFPLIQTLTLTLRKPDILANCSVGICKVFHY